MIVLSVPYIVKIMSRSLLSHETVLQTSATNIQIEKLQTTFSMVSLFQGLPLNNYGVECKENSTM